MQRREPMNVRDTGPSLSVAAPSCVAIADLAHPHALSHIHDQGQRRRADQSPVTTRQAWRGGARRGVGRRGTKDEMSVTMDEWMNGCRRMGARRRDAEMSRSPSGERHDHDHGVRTKNQRSKSNQIKSN